MEFYKVGVEMGEADCQCEYARGLLCGEGVPLDVEGGLAMLKRLADQDDSGALLLLGE